MKRFLLFVLFVALAAPSARAQQQFQGVCSRVRMIIEQELTLERVGFEARLEVTNNDGNDPVTDFFANLTFNVAASGTNAGGAESSALFFVQAPTFETINAVDGSGVIGPTKKAVVRWFIIPKVAAGGTSPDGLKYSVGCTLSGKMRGVTLPSDVLFAIPATITVHPDPQLEITYFQPRDVQGDDPFTPEIESPIPFTLGVFVKNVGYGPARKVKIDSKQPKIVSNANGLLLVAQLLGARVQDSPLNVSSLLVDLGDIMPGQTKKGAWDMITSLSGEFIEFKASYTHASELGGQETSLIKSLNAYFIAHEVLNDQPGRDAIKDFLAITDNNEDLVPTALYESEGNVQAVNYLTNATVVGSAGPGGSFQVQLAADVAGWGYLRLVDPGQAKLKISSVVRSDGKVLNTNNCWTNIRYTKIGNIRQNWLNIFDLVALNTYTYTVTYAPSLADTTPPVTTMHFAGSVNQSGGKYYITPDTQIYFIAEDVNPVSMFYSVTNGPFVPALPFTLTTPGEYPIAFYAIDSSNNREANHTNIVVVTGSGALDFASVGSIDQPFYVSGDALSVRPLNAPLTFAAAFDPSQVDARIEVFQGVVGWATVAGVPSSPTTNTTASLVVGGNYVDLYRYQVNGGAWSADQPVSSPLVLSGLSGSVSVGVQGRSQYGTYLDPSNAVTVAWVVSPNAPATRITGTPPTPSRLRNVSFNIGGNGVTAFRWTTNSGYYRAESNAPAVLALAIASAGAQPMTLAVLGKTNGVFQPTNMPTTVAWQFDPLFGYTLPGLYRVTSYTLTNIGVTPRSFTWDGTSDTSAIMPPGWYTIRITLQDQLGRTNFATRLVQIGDFTGTAATVADIGRGPKNPTARGRWAAWQDQSSGSWGIYAQDIASNGPILQITSTPLSQENPKLDGRYLVWQGRQTNGNWDVYLKDLQSAAVAQALVVSPTIDEVNPAIDWPWVVCQRRASGNAGAPWQLTANNLVTGQRFTVWPSSQDQLDPDVQAGRVVWQDWRDVGAGEIYFANLETGELQRITTNLFGQYHPVLYNNWIVWQDNRNGQVDLYGYDLSRKVEVRLTSTAENESRPFLDGPWAICLEDSLGPLTANARLLYLPTQAAVPLTRTSTFKDRPAMAAGKALWLDTSNNLARVMAVDLPSLQAVFQNRNAVVVTPSMVSFQNNAYTLLTLWRQQAGVAAITHYTSLVPQVVSETATWSNGVPTGPNFTLTAGDFLWVKFNTPWVVDLGVDNSGALNLVAGANVVSYTAFPSAYTAFRLLNQVGLANCRGVRMLDAESGRWVVADVLDGRPVGTDFPIPRVAVVMLDLNNPVSNFKPQ